MRSFLFTTLVKFGQKKEYEQIPCKFKLVLVTLFKISNGYVTYNKKIKQTDKPNGIEIITYFLRCLKFRSVFPNLAHSLYNSANMDLSSEQIKKTIPNVACYFRRSWSDNFIDKLFYFK